MKKSLALTTIMFANVLFASSLVFAEEGSITDSITFQVAIGDFLTLTLDDTESIAHLSPSSTLSSGMIKAIVSTNNLVGYTLTMKDKDDSNELERSGYTAFSKKDPSFYRIPSISEDVSLDALAEDTWGYSLNEEQLYHPVPLAEIEISSSDAPITGDITNVNFGVKTSPTRPTGVYEDTISFMAVANIASVSLEQSYVMAGKSKVEIDGNEYYLMQDMTTDICAVANDIPSELMVADSRDNKTYWIAKLADGHCWMTQNLDFDISSNAILTSSDTDLSEYGTAGYTDESGYSRLDDGTIVWEPINSTILPSQIDSNGHIEGWNDDSHVPYSVDIGNWYWIGEWTESIGHEFLAQDVGNPQVFRQTPYESNGKHGHLGNYYNWQAAMATNQLPSGFIRAQNSICPAGWRLPFSDGSYEITKLENLYASGTADKQLISAPLYFVRGGDIWWNDYGHIYAGASGQLWVNGRLGDNFSGSYYQFMNGSTGSGSTLRGTGKNIRCIAR